MATDMAAPAADLYHAEAIAKMTGELVGFVSRFDDDIAIKIAALQSAGDLFTRATAAVAMTAMIAKSLREP
jgi:hypothetical protein